MNPEKYRDKIIEVKFDEKKNFENFTCSILIIDLKKLKEE